MDGSNKFSYLLECLLKQRPIITYSSSDLRTNKIHPRGYAHHAHDGVDKEEKNAPETTSGGKHYQT